MGVKLMNYRKIINHGMRFCVGSNKGKITHDVFGFFLFSQKSRRFMCENVERDTG